MTTNHDQEIIKKALIIETQQRTAFIEQIEDIELRKKVEFLLQDDQALTEFLIQTSDGSTPIETVSAKEFEAGDRIKQFLIKRLIAKGGMGSVYLAFDEKLKRNVAIKTIRAEYLKNKATQQRFKQEAQILSQINHPAICQIYDYIDFEDGDVLVLELVEGMTLNQAELNKKQKLDVFVNIASALVVAHAKNVIHRDLKPDNIMLTQEGGIKILDFGIAKSTVLDKQKDTFVAVSDDDEPKHVTKMGSLMGTLLYMSPEQAMGKEVTAASDMYSLGIIMQEMLTGVAVYDLNNTNNLKKQVVSASTRNTELIPKKYINLIQDLTHKNPNKRLDAEETLIRLRKVKDLPKTRLKKIVTAVVVSLFILGFVKYTYDLNIQKQQAISERIKAEQSKQESDKVTEFLEGLFLVSDPYRQQGKDITARELLDQGSKKINEELKEQPEVLLRLKITIGNIYMQLGLYDSARQQFTESEKLIEMEKLQNPDLLIELRGYEGALDMSTGHLDQAESIFKQLLMRIKGSKTYRKEKYLDTKYDLAVVQYKLGKFDTAAQAYNELLNSYSMTDKSHLLKIIQIFNSLGQLNWQLERLPEAEKYMKKALKLLSTTATKSLEVKLTVLNNLSNVMGDMGNSEEALDYGLRSLKLKKQILPKNHSSIALSYDNLSIIYCNIQEFKKCKDFNSKALEIYRNSLGENSLDYAITMGNRAGILSHVGDYTEAIEVVKKVILILKKIRGENNDDVAFQLKNLGRLYFIIDDYPQSIEKLKESIAIYEKLNYPMNTTLISGYKYLAQAYDKNNNSKDELITYQALLQKITLSNDSEVQTTIIPEIKKKILKLTQKNK